MRQAVIHGVVRCRTADDRSSITLTSPPAPPSLSQSTCEVQTETLGGVATMPFSSYFYTDTVYLLNAFLMEPQGTNQVGVWGGGVC